MMQGHSRQWTIKLAALCLLTLPWAQGTPQRARHSASRRAAVEAKTPDPANAGRVSDIRFWTQTDTTRIAVEVTSGYKMKSDRLQNPDRLFFDIIGVKPQAGKGIQTITVGDARIKQIRVAETQPGTTRLVLDLSSAVDFDASQLTNPDRLIIEVRPHGAARRQPSAEPAVTSAHKRFVPPATPARTPLAPAEIDVTPPRIAAHVEGPVIPAQKIKTPPPTTGRETLRSSLTREPSPRESSPKRETPVASSAHRPHRPRRKRRPGHRKPRRARRSHG